MAKPRKPFAKSGGKGGGAEDEFTIERGIDAIDQLREKMRQAGMTDCADALDEVFIRCLRNYVSGDEPKPEPEVQPTLTKKADDTLN